MERGWALSTTPNAAQKGREGSAAAERVTTTANRCLLLLLLMSRGVVMVGSFCVIGKEKMEILD